MKLSFTLEEIARATSGEILRGDPQLVVKSISTDSRHINSSQLFIPLKGERFEGHQFLASAYAAGAVACICQPEYLDNAKDFSNVIVVANTLISLQKIAQVHRTKFNLPLVALTGSCGKTMVKELTVAALSEHFRTLASPGNINNEFGLPLQILELLPEHEVAVMELGTNHPGEMAVLCEVCMPTAGIWTNVGMGHIGHFGSLEAIREEKSALVKAIPPDGIMILNADDPLVISSRTLCRGKVVTYGIDSYTDYRAEKIVVTANGVSFIVNGVAVNSILLGKHSVSNILAALALAHQWGIDLAKGAAAITAVQPLGRRLAIKHLGGVILIDDCYNSNPSSLKIALEILKEQPGKRHVAVLGDMLELGDFAVIGHRAAGEITAKLGIDRLLLTGAHAQDYKAGALSAGMSEPAVEILTDTSDLVEELLKELADGDVILVKASRAMEFEVISEAIKSKWGERS